MTVAYLTHSDFLLHEMGAMHPESPARLRAIDARIRECDFFNKMLTLNPPPATRAQLERAHGFDYVQSVFDTAPQHGMRMLDADTTLNPYSLSAALHAAGAVIEAVDRSMRGEIDAAFCAVRPPGHHAEHQRAMGFCIFNNVAIGAAHALFAHGLQRIAIVDFDVHHGNGTQDIFAHDNRVLFCSTFQHPFYPYSGLEETKPHIVNDPLPAGSDGKRFREVVATRWIPALDAFQPELILISAGFDAHRDDLLGGLGWVEDDYYWVTGEIKKVAMRHARGRIVSTLEGGYSLDALARSVEAHIRALLE